MYLEVINMPTKNPLRYPGAKSKLVPYIQTLLENEHLQNCTFYEAYAGSAAVSFGLLENNVIQKAKINELDPLIYNFWYAAMNRTDELIYLINNTDITVENWIEFAKYRDTNYLHNKTPVQIGFAGLFLNRTNFSGILKANPLGGLKQKSSYKIDCRFNKQRIIESIQKLSTYSSKVELFNLDAITFLKQETYYKRNRTFFVYIDPPYYEKGSSLYRYYYENHMHYQLAQYIKVKSYPWLISYDDSPEIKKMYKARTLQQIYLDYSVNTKRKEKELLISNLEIPPLENTNFVEQLIG